MRISIALVSIVCIAAHFCAAGVRIIENTSKRLSFEWTTEDIKIIQSAQGPTRLSFARANVDIGENNEPIIPAFSFYVGVPQQGEAMASFSASVSHSVTLSQSPRIKKASALYKKYRNLTFAQQWLSNGRQGQIGALNCRQFILRPFAYDPATKVLNVLDKGVFIITFPSATFRGAATSQPKSDYKKMARKLVLNYDVAKGWPTPSALGKRASIKQFPLAMSDTMPTFTVGDGHGGICEGTIDENGVIKIMGSDLIRLFGSRVALSRIALYASYKGEMPSMTPAYADIPDGVSEVPLLRFDNGKADSIDPSAYVLAYVSGVSDWQYDSQTQKDTFNLDSYEDYRHYWIVVKSSGSGLSLLRWTPVAAAGSDTITSSKGHYLLKRSAWKSFSERDGGLSWAWTILTSNNPVFQYNNVTLPFVDASAPCSVAVEMGYTAGYPAINLAYGGSSVCGNCGYSSFYPVSYPGDGQPVSVSIASRAGDSVELKSIEFRYMQKLDLTGQSSMTIFSAEAPGIANYRLTGLGNNLVYLFRISNNDQSIMLMDTVRGAGSYGWTDSTGIGIRYYVCTETGMKQTPSIMSRIPNAVNNFVVTNLRNYSPPAIDYLVICHPDFLTEAQRLVRHKWNIRRFANPKVVSIADVYAQFSGGNTDPAAIRNCLAYVTNYQETYLKDSSLNYVVLMGAGNYDYRGLSASQTPSYIPVAEIGDNCIDDYFVYLRPGTVAEANDTTATPSMFLGRFPCHNTQEAKQMVDKVIATEDPVYANIGGWRNRMLLVADDDMQGNAPDPLRTQHTESSELVDSLIESLSPVIDIRKVYLFDYPWNNQDEKPEASQALINTINSGVAIVNYFGHGAANVWADEHILQQSNIGNLVNTGMYPLINSFSCAVGMFDRPGSNHSLSEYLVVASQSGALSAISSTREAYASYNEDLAMNFYAAVFDTADSSIARSYGQCLAEAKFICHDDNQKVYCFLGDPSTSFLRPFRKISLTISAADGSVLDTTLKALQQVTVKGSIGSLHSARADVPDPSFGSSQTATVQITMFNPAYLANRKDGGTVDPDVQYWEPGTPLFSGTTQIKGGVFTQRILIPKNVTLDKAGAKIAAFAYSGQDIGAGAKNNILFHGFDTTVVSDTSGPVISIRPVYAATASAAKGASFTDKITVSCPFTLEVDVFDSNGVDAVSTGPDEGLTYEMSGPKTQARKNINQQFQFVSGDYRRGNAMISFDANGNWPLGSYKMTVSAQDLLGNVTHHTFDVEIIDEQDLAISHVFNYPNPVRLGQSTKFYFDLSRATNDDARVMIRIFTMSGRLIKVMENATRGQLFDGKDQFGNYLSPGVYLYQISAADQQKVVKSKIEKLAINPPR